MTHLGASKVRLRKVLFVDYLGIRTNLPGFLIFLLTLLLSVSCSKPETKATPYSLTQPQTTGPPASVIATPAPIIIAAPTAAPSSPLIERPALFTTPTPILAENPFLTAAPSPLQQDVLPTPGSTLDSKALWKEVSPPSGVGFPNAQWIAIEVAEGKSMLAAVFRPADRGPRPAVIVFHGTEGFWRHHVELAEYFALNGLTGIAAGWFGGHYQISGSQIIPLSPPEGAISYPGGPDIPLTPPVFQTATRNSVTFIQAVKNIPGVQAGSIGLLGHSRGSVIVLRAASVSPDPAAVVAVAGYPTIDRANFIQAPVLILQGTDDDIIPVRQGRQFEEALKASGKSVESYYYDEAPHRIPWLSPWQDDVRRRALAFFKKHLAP